MGKSQRGAIDQSGAFFSRAAKKFRLVGSDGVGWRRPQIGALGAMLAHWSLDSREPTVVSTPTGTGKTAVAMAAPLLTAPAPKRVLVLAPARQVREQLARQFRTYAQLHNLGALPDSVGAPHVFEMSGRATNWAEIAECDVVVALPNSISPLHYDENHLPPRDLFDMIIVDEAHHAPADTWRAVLDYFQWARALLLTATPRRRDGKRIPGSLVYYYPLRRALDEHLYNPIQPILIPSPTPSDKAASDRLIAVRVADLLSTDAHKTSVAMVRAGSIGRLRELEKIYAGAGLSLSLLHHALSERTQREIVEGLQSGKGRLVGVVGMLGEGFDLPALRVVAYHDKHRSLPATIQLIGRLARVDPAHPQQSALVTVADADVFPELQGVVRQLYQEDADWVAVLPGIIDREVQSTRDDREFGERFPESQTEVDPLHLRPLKRALVYEVPSDWEPPIFGGELPENLRVGAIVNRGTVVYSGADPESRILAVVLRYVEAPRWSSDPALANVTYELHVVGHRRPPRVDLPALLMLNIDRDGVRSLFEEVLGLGGVGRLVGPERIGHYIDSLERLSVSSVGVRSTNAATRGRAAYRNYMGAGVDRGLRSVDMARSALGHVMFQVTTEEGSTNAGAAVEKSKLWHARYGKLREFASWVDAVAASMWFPRLTTQGPLLPGVDRGVRLEAWPQARPLAAEMYPALLGVGLELFDSGQRVGAIEDLDLYVNDDPSGTIADIGAPSGDVVRIVGVLNDRGKGTQDCVWDGSIDTAGQVTATKDLTVRRGYSDVALLSEILEQDPPTIYFVDGTTTIGAVRYSSRGTAPSFNPAILQAIEWDNIDLTAETATTAEKRGTGKKSVHDRLAEYLVQQPKRGSSRWILHNDGAGELSDYVVVEELPTGELHVALWHAKASRNANPGLRVKDFQEVVAQALRSRRWIPSTNLWDELGKRMTGLSKPVATLVEGSDDAEILRRRLGLVPPASGEASDQPWTRRYPVIRAALGVVQPGLSVGELLDGLNANDVSDSARSLRELFSVLADTAMADGADLVILGSP